MFLSSTAKALALLWPFIMVWMGRGSHGELQFTTPSSERDAGTCERVDMKFTPLRGKIRPASRALRRTKSYSQPVVIRLGSRSGEKSAKVKFYRTSDCAGSPLDSLTLTPQKEITYLVYYAHLSQAGEVQLVAEVDLISSSSRGWPRDWKGAKTYGGILPGPVIKVSPLATAKITVKAPKRAEEGDCVTVSLSLRDKLDNLFSDRSRTLKLSADSGLFYGVPKCLGPAIRSVSLSKLQTSTILYFRDTAKITGPVRRSLVFTDDRSPALTATLSLALDPIPSPTFTPLPGEFSITSTPGYLPAISELGTASATMAWGKSEGAVRYSGFISQSKSCGPEAKAQALYSFDNHYGTYKNFADLSTWGAQYACVFAHYANGANRLAGNSPFLWLGGARGPAWSPEICQSHDYSLPTVVEQEVYIRTDSPYPRFLNPFNFSSRTGGTRLPVHHAYFQTTDHRLLYWGAGGDSTAKGNHYVEEYDIARNEWNAIHTGITSDENSIAGLPFQSAISNKNFILREDTQLITWNENLGAGGYIDLDEERVLSLPSGGPSGFGSKGSNRTRPKPGFSTQLIVGDHLVLCGAVREDLIGKKGHQPIDDRCYIFSFEENRWLSPTPPLPSPATHLSMVALGTRKFAVWGGADVFWGNQYNSQFSNRGYLYDLDTQKWTPMNTKGAPSGRASAAFGWTGKEIYVLGGYSQRLLPTPYFSGFTWVYTEGFYLNDGGLYNPATDSWRPILTGWGPGWPPFNRAYRDLIRSQWIKDRLVVPDGRILIP